MAKALLMTAMILGHMDRRAVQLMAIAGGIAIAPVVMLVIAIATLVAAVTAPFGGSEASGAPPVPPAHLAVMLEVSAESGVPWELLAAIASVESGFGANMSTSWANAIGYGQFLPSSWEAFGEGGDPYDYHDVIPAMARYLVAAGVHEDIPNAVWAYNHSWEYVALVLGRAAYYASAGLVPMPTPVSPTSQPTGVPS